MMLRVSILTIGDELVTGEMEDNNAPWLARLARSYGHRVVGFATVEDEVGAVAREVTRAREVADLLLVSGGLGPTEDDLTREGVTAALGIELQRSEAVMDRLRSCLGSEPSPGAARQADLPAGAQVLPNERGTAPGFLVRLDEFALACVPGVPSEMRPMARALFQREWASGPAADTRRLLVCGLPEAELGRRLEDLMDMTRTDVRVGITTVGGLHTVSVRGHDRGALEFFAHEVAGRLGDDLVCEGERTLAQTVVTLLARHELTVSVAESCTGGLLSGALTSVAGSSRVFREGVVCYADEAKTERLGVPAELLAAHGAVSEPVAEAMARGQLARSGAHRALAITGIAGPDGGSEDKPVGTVVVALANNTAVEVATLHWMGSRDEIRSRAVNAALDLLRRRLLRL